MALRIVSYLSWTVLQAFAEEPLIQDPFESQRRPCSCDCCHVEERLPAEVQMLSTGQRLTHKCVTPEADTEQCPNTCEISNHDMVLSSADGPVDYARYCLYKCQPVSPPDSDPTVGGLCSRQDLDESWMARVPDGNGRVIPAGSGSGPPQLPFFAGGSVPAPAAGPSGYIWRGSSPAPAVSVTITKRKKTGWEAVIEEKKKERIEEAKKAEREDEEKQRVVYDLRKLYAERLRAQAGAMASHEIAAGERVRLSSHKIQRNSGLLDKAALVAEDMEASIDGAVAAAQANASFATEETSANAQLFTKAKMAMRSILNQTRKLTTSMVTQGTQEMARQEAEAYARRMLWDKPENYGRVLAYHAAEPYQEQMLVATQRVADYENQAEGLFNQANVAQTKALDLASKVDATEESGDNVGAVIEKRRSRNLLRTSRELQQRAEKLWNTAQQTRASIPQWQNASWLATVHTFWKYQTARNSARATTTQAPALQVAAPGAVVSPHY